MLWFTILVFFVGLWIYLLYPVIFIISSKGHNNKEAETPEEPPSVEIIIPAYLEFKNIHYLINDCLRQHYPADLLKITLVVDGPLPENFTDQLPSKVQLLHSSKRMGKAQALNRAVA
nr:glycosyltransferase [Sediminibacterium sp.]